MRALRVLHCPTTCAGNPQQLARAEREVGLRSWSVAFGGNRYRYEADEIVSNPVLVELKRWELLRRALRDYDVVHFNMGRSLFPPFVTSFGTMNQRGPAIAHYAYHAYARALDMADLRLLHRARKGIVVTYQGGDARPGAYTAAHYDPSGRHAAAADPGSRANAWRRLAVEKFDRYADRLYYLNPDLARYLPPRASFLPYANVDLRVWRPPAPRPSTTCVRTVAHAPTVRDEKGTSYVVEAIEALRADGIEVELRLLEGQTREEVKLAYEASDIVVDQLLAGWYGGVAVEAMALAKPTVCYLRDSDLGVIPDEMRAELPLIRAEPATLAAVLRDWVRAPDDRLRDAGAAGRAFVERWHDPVKIAARLKDEYEEIVASKTRGPETAAVSRHARERSVSGSRNRSRR